MAHLNDYFVFIYYYYYYYYYFFLDFGNSENSTLPFPDLRSKIYINFSILNKLLDYIKIKFSSFMFYLFILRGFDCTATAIISHMKLIYKNATLACQLIFVYLRHFDHTKLLSLFFLCIMSKQYFDLLRNFSSIFFWSIIIRHQKATL